MPKTPINRLLDGVPWQPLPEIDDLTADDKVAVRSADPAVGWKVV